MNDSGYDNAISISEFCDDDIKTVETYVNSHLKHLIENVEVYKKVHQSNQQFVFLPGHKKLLLSLKNKLKEFQISENVGKKTKKSAETLAENPCETLTETNQTIEELELFTEDELKKLKTGLRTKLTKFVQNIGLVETEYANNKVSVPEGYISHSKSLSHKAGYKCTVECIICEKNIPCTWNSYWQTGNLEKHIRICHETYKSKELQKNNDPANNIANNDNLEKQNIIDKSLDKSLNSELDALLEIE